MTELHLIRNIGILAHVDAGKTSLTENMLLLSNSIKKAGSVDKGTSTTDFLDVEKERGISIRSAITYFNWKNYRINIVDTPGHIDFSSEVERSLSVLDAAVLVISAVDGIQPQTEAIWDALQALKIPVIIFINKIDRPGSDLEMVVNEIEKEFKKSLFLFQDVKDEENIDVAVVSPDIKDLFTQKPELIEKVAETDDVLLDKFLEDETISIDDLLFSLKSAVEKQMLIPVLYGSAKTAAGIDSLLDAIINWLPSPNGNNDELSGLIFSVIHDDKIGKLCGVRLFGGKLSVRDSVNFSSASEEKISIIRKYSGISYEQIDSFGTGEYAFVGGLSSAKIGDIIGHEPDNFSSYNFDVPLLSVRLEAVNDSDYPKLAGALHVLSIEDPLLNLDWDKDEKELNIRIRGVIQAEIIESVLKSRFNIEAVFGEPNIIYKETPKKTGLAYANYTMPKPCWAIVTFRIEPGERGSGISYKSEVSVNNIKQRYQNEIQNAIGNALKQGIKGWEVTDIIISLIKGEDHEIHSRPGDFIIATNMAVMNGLSETNTDLLEPVLAFSISAPEENLGRIAGDLHKMRASFNNPVFDNGKVKLEGKIPLASSLKYSVELSSLTGGKGKFSTRLSTYEKIPDELGKIRKYKGISPLDRSKYILKMRGAIN